VGVRGDFKGLRNLQVQLGEVARGHTQRELAQVLAAEARELVDEGFATSTAPDGSSWDPLKQRAGQPLRDTGRLQRSYTSSVTNRGFSIGTNTRYAVTHQEGRTIVPVRAKMLRWSVGGKTFTAKKVEIPARPMVPDGELGPKWTRAFKDAAREVINDRFRG
jgi:phage virion morphogenesis protein